MNSLHKICLLAAIAFFSIAPASSQVGLTGGLIGGVSTGAVKVGEMGTSFTESIEGRSIYGFEGGVYSKVFADPLFLRLQVLYGFRGGQVNYKDNSGPESVSRNNGFNFHKITVPLLLGVHVLGPVFLEVGPVYNHTVSITENYNEHWLSLGTSGLGYRAGAGIELGGLMLYVAYEKSTYIAGKTGAVLSEPYQLIFGLGIQLYNNNKQRF